MNRFLLDTHAILWWLTEDSSIPARARRTIADKHSNVFVSSVSAWEIATKVRLGRLKIGEEIVANFSEYLAQQRFDSLPITMQHAVRAGSLPGPQDPFDRMLIAQALHENLKIVSNEKIFDGYGIERVWST